MQTLGHIYFPEALSDNFPFQRRISKDGVPSHSGACPLCKNLQQWVTDSYRIYAEIQPNVLFIDDDFRTYMTGALSCFCKQHLEKMAALYGKKITREEIVFAIYSDKWPAPKLRAIYFEVTTAGFVELATIIRQTVKSASPQTKLGVMTASWPFGAAGVDWDKVLKAMAGDEVPLLRPQLSCYRENSPKDLPLAVMNTDRFRAVLPPNVEFWPEIENYPYTLYSKSSRFTLAQIFSLIMNGFNHHALNLFDTFGQRFNEYKKFISMFEMQMPYFKALLKLLPEGSRPHGVKACMHKDALLVRRSTEDWFGGRSLANFIPSLGLPLTHSGDSKWQILCGDDVLAFNDAELYAILSKGALMDVTAAEALALRGQSERIGVKVGNYLQFDELGYESFIWPGHSAKQEENCFPLRAFINDKPDWRVLIPCGKQNISASEIHNFCQHKTGNGLLLNENSQGERFAVLAFSQKTASCLMENHLRAEQIRHVLEWIAREPLPFSIASRTAYLWPILNSTADGRWIVGIINLSTDRVEAIPAFLGKELSTKTLMILNSDGKVTQAVTKIIKQDNNESISEIYYTLEPLEYVTFIFQ